MRSAIVAAIALATALASCAKADVPQNANAPQSSSKPNIGVATMEKDGTIVLLLRSEAEDGTVAESEFRIKPGAPNYESTLQHLGGLKPGETKPVAPWPEQPQNH